MPAQARRDVALDGSADSPFQALYRGFPSTRPQAKVDVATESPKGEFGIYLVADGTNKPYRVKIRPTGVQPPPSDGFHDFAAYARRRYLILGATDIVFGEVDQLGLPIPCRARAVALLANVSASAQRGQDDIVQANGSRSRSCSAGEVFEPYGRSFSRCFLQSRKSGAVGRVRLDAGECGESAGNHRPSSGRPATERDPSVARSCPTPGRGRDQDPGLAAGSGHRVSHGARMPPMRALEVATSIRCSTWYRSAAFMSRSAVRRPACCAVRTT